MDEDEVLKDIQRLPNLLQSYYDIFLILFIEAFPDKRWK